MGAALSMEQALNRSQEIQVTCNIRSLDDPRWQEKFFGSESRGEGHYNPRNKGLDIAFGGHKRAVAEHNEFWLFNIEESAYDIMSTLFRGAPNQDNILSAIAVKRKRRSHYHDEFEISRTVD